MAENPTQETTLTAPTTEAETEVPTGRLQSFVLKHPRTAMVVAITGAITGAIGVFSVAKHMRNDHDELDSPNVVVGEVVSSEYDYSTSESPQTQEA